MLIIKNLNLISVQSRTYLIDWSNYHPWKAHGDDLRWKSNPNICRLANVTCKTRDEGQHTEEKSRISCRCRDKKTADRQKLSHRKTDGQTMLKLSSIWDLKGPTATQKYRPHFRLLSKLLIIACCLDPIPTLLLKSCIDSRIPVIVGFRNFSCKLERFCSYTFAEEIGSWLSL